MNHTTQPANWDEKELEASHKRYELMAASIYKAIKANDAHMNLIPSLLLTSSLWPSPWIKKLKARLNSLNEWYTPDHPVGQSVICSAGKTFGESAQLSELQEALRTLGIENERLRVQLGELSVDRSLPNPLQ